MSIHNIIPLYHRDITILYGFDESDFGGYFVRIYNYSKSTEDNEDGLILSEDSETGITREKLLSILNRAIKTYDIHVGWNIKIHLELIEKGQII